MDQVTIGILGILLLLILLAVRLPVGISMTVVAVLGFYLIVSPGGALSKLGGDTFLAVKHYSLSVIPLFVLMGMFLSKARLGEDLYVFLDAIMAKFRGGMAMATIGAGAAFGAVCGSVVASASTVSTIAVPEMRKLKYDEGLATSVSAVGSTLGVVIPPSTALVLYGVLTEEPIGRILLGGIIPGIMTMIILMFTVYLLLLWRPKLAPEVKKERPPFPWDRLKYVWAVPVIFLLTMGGIYGGYFTPTEAGAIGAFLSMLVSLITRRLGVGEFTEAVSHSVRITAMVFLIVIGGKLFGSFLTISQIPIELSNMVMSMDVAPIVVIITFIVVYFFLGIFMDELATLVIMTPMVYPLIISLGYDGVWFGVLSIMMLLTGLLTPPVGVVSLVVSSVTKVPAARVFSSQVPFWFALLAATLLVALFPSLSLFLPETMM